MGKYHKENNRLVFDKKADSDEIVIKVFLNIWFVTEFETLETDNGKATYLYVAFRYCISLVTHHDVRQEVGKREKLLTSLSYLWVYYKLNILNVFAIISSPLRVLTASITLSLLCFNDFYTLKFYLFIVRQNDCRLC